MTMLSLTIIDLKIDRTSELRAKGYERRRLGNRQMTTDTAVITTIMVVQGQRRLEDIEYRDDPDLKIDEHETVSMPFRYVLDKEGQVVMPKVCLSPHDDA